MAESCEVPDSSADTELLSLHSDDTSKSWVTIGEVDDADDFEISDLNDFLALQRVSKDRQVKSTDDAEEDAIPGSDEVAEQYEKGSDEKSNAIEAEDAHISLGIDAAAEVERETQGALSGSDMLKSIEQELAFVSMAFVELSTEDTPTKSTETDSARQVDEVELAEANDLRTDAAKAPDSVASEDNSNSVGNDSATVATGETPNEDDAIANANDQPQTESGSLEQRTESDTEQNAADTSELAINLEQVNQADLSQTPSTSTATQLQQSPQCSKQSLDESVQMQAVEALPIEKSAETPCEVQTAPAEPATANSTTSEDCSSLLCPICKDNLVDLASFGASARPALQSAPCGHTFHKDCLRQSVELDPICPVCRFPCNDETYDERAVCNAKLAETANQPSASTSAAKQSTPLYPPIQAGAKKTSSVTLPNLLQNYVRKSSRLDILTEPRLVDEIRAARNMPVAQLEMHIDEDLCLPGCSENGCIVLVYKLQNAVLGEIEPGCPIFTFLPNVPEGRRVAKLLRKAFTDRWTFIATGERNSKGAPSVVWGPITHKTELFGSDSNTSFYAYPDNDYLARVVRELNALGVHSD